MRAEIMGRPLAVSIPNVFGTKLRLLPEWLGGISASVVWAGLVGTYAMGFFSSFAEGLRPAHAFLDVLFFIALIVLPIMLFIGAAAFLSRLRVHVEETDALRGEIAQLREAMLLQSPTGAEAIAAIAAAAISREHKPLSQQIASIEANQSRLEEALLAVLQCQERAGHQIDETLKQVSLRRSLKAGEAASAEAAQEQVPLPLETTLPPPETPDWGELATALDFPRDGSDREGFRLMRKAQRHHGYAQLLRSAEDVLTLLAEDGIFMEDLTPELAPAPKWRTFAKGERGASIGAVGGIDDPTALALTQSRMKSDHVFRDTALHFLRRFDIVLREFAENADDADLLALGNCRTGRAFMLLARVSGAFGTAES